MLSLRCVQLCFGPVVLRTVPVQLLTGYRMVCEPEAVLEADIAPTELVERVVPGITRRARVARWVYGKPIPCYEAVWWIPCHEVVWLRYLH